MFFVQHQCFWFQKKQVEKQDVLVKRGAATISFRLSTCVFQNVKSYRFFVAISLQILVDAHKKHYKNRYFNTFLKAKNWKEWPFLMVTSWATLMVTNWATLAPLQKRQRGPVSNH